VVTRFDIGSDTRFITSLIWRDDGGTASDPSTSLMTRTISHGTPDHSLTSATAKPSASTHLAPRADSANRSLAEYTNLGEVNEAAIRTPE
jgi:hypothetical protein